MYNYNNQPCPLCGKHMHDGDDIVFCPECATPQHRECWLSEGHCVNQALHASGFEWKPREQTTFGMPEAEAEENTETVICPSCGKENPRYSLHCSSCGELLEKHEIANVCRFCGTENEPETKICSNCGAPLVFENRYFSDKIYMHGVDMTEDEKLGDVTVGDAALFVQSNAKRYIPKFKKISDGKYVSFNWAAFLFSPWWFFFRKLYKSGIILLILFSSISLMTYGFTEQIYKNLTAAQDGLIAIREEYADKTDDASMQEAFEKEYAVVQKLRESSKKPALILAAIVLAEHLVSGFIANIIYYKKVCKSTKTVNSAEAAEPIKKSIILQTGGTSLIALAAGFLGEQALNSLLSMIAEKLIAMK